MVSNSGCAEDGSGAAYEAALKPTEPLWVDGNIISNEQGLGHHYKVHDKRMEYKLYIKS